METHNCSFQTRLCYERRHCRRFYRRNKSFREPHSQLGRQLVYTQIRLIVFLELCCINFNIINWDIKPSTLFLKNSGHIMITDLNSAFDMSIYKCRPRQEDFRGTPKYMSPEVSIRQKITFKFKISNLS